MLISANAQKILKIIHLLAIANWMGGELAQVVLLYASNHAQSADELFGILKSFKFVNFMVTIYLGAYGSLFTGLVYSVCTNRGFIRHKWIIIKWLLTLGMILFGTFWLANWGTVMLERAHLLGLDCLQDPEYLMMHRRMAITLVVYIALFTLATILSVYKPWEYDEIMAQQKRLQSFH